MRGVSANPELARARLSSNHFIPNALKIAQIPLA
jgi:hypothetical protein